MSVENDQLIIPPAAADDPESWEILRLWGSQGDQLVTISPEIGGGPTGFGAMLAQLARHGANLFESRDGLEPSESLRLMREGFDNEWSKPSASTDPEPATQ